MSAWIVSKTHVDALITAGIRWGAGGGINRTDWQDDKGNWVSLNLENASEVGDMLVRENVRSVDNRYEDADTLPGPIEPYYMEPYRWTELGLNVDPCVVLKAISCYEYQSCEHDGWETSEAKRFCEALRDSAIHALPGYEAAPWGVDDPEIFGGKVRRLV